MDQIFLSEVNEKDFRFLYNLLKQRKPWMNISHKKIPTFSEHVMFVKSTPYKKWYIIKNKNKKIGSIYLSKNDEIGIFLKEGLEKKGIGKTALNILMEKNPRKRYLANINPQNKKSIRFFMNNGFDLIQFTYEFVKNE